MRLKTLCLPAILPVLALSATQLVAQPQEARLDMGIRVQHTLPEGWQANLDGYRLTFWAEDQSLRALFIESPSPLLQGSLHEVGEPEFGPVHTRQAVLMNEAVTLYRLEMSRFSLGAAQAQGGEMILAQIDRCIAPVTEDQIFEVRLARSGNVAPVVLGFYSAAGFDAFDPGVGFAPIMAALEIELPSHLAACPADLGEHLQAITAPRARDDGQLIWSLYGLDMALPVEFQPFQIAAETAQFEGPGLVSGTHSDLQLFTNAQDIDFTRRMFASEVGPDALQVSTVDIGTLGRFTLFLADMSDDPQSPVIGQFMSADDAGAPLGLILVTEADGSGQFDAAAVLAMHRQITGSLAASADGSVPLVLDLPGRFVLRDAAQEIAQIERPVGQGLSLRAGLPLGWEVEELADSVSLMSEVRPRQLVMVGVSFVAPVTPDDFLPSVRRQRGTIGGHAASLFIGESAANRLGYLSNADRGGLALAVLDDCIGTGHNAQAVTVVLYSETGQGAPMDDPVLANLLAGLELQLPDSAAPCPPALTTELEAFAKP